MSRFESRATFYGAVCAGPSAKQSSALPSANDIEARDVGLFIITV